MRELGVLLKANGIVALLAFAFEAVPMSVAEDATTSVAVLVVEEEEWRSLL